MVGVTTAGENTLVLTVGTAAGAGTLNISSGDLTINSTVMVVGGGNVGTVNLSGGTLTASGLRVGNIGFGFFNMSGGTFVAGTVFIPTASPGTSGSFVISGGTLTLSSTMTIGDALNSSPVYADHRGWRWVIRRD